MRWDEQLMKSHGIIASFANGKHNCLRIVESANPQFPNGYVIIRVNDHCFMSLTRVEQEQIMMNESIESIETIPFEMWLLEKAEQQKEKKRAKNRVANLTDEQLQKKREKDRLRIKSPAEMERQRLRNRVENMTPDRIESFRFANQ